MTTSMTVCDLRPVHPRFLGSKLAHQPTAILTRYCRSSITDNRLSFLPGGSSDEPSRHHPHRRRRPALAPAHKTAAVTRVRYLERQIFDDDGRRRRNIKEPLVDELVGQINQLRQSLGWLEIDLHGQWRWPN